MSREYTMGNVWGDSIQWSDIAAFNRPFTDKSIFRVTGWKSNKPKPGDTLKAEFEKSWIWFRFKKVEPCGDPHDMFFADVSPFQQQLK